MSHTLACEASDLFAGTAPVSFGISGGSSPAAIVENCRSTMTRGIDVIHFHGTADSTVDYDNGVLDSLGAPDSLAAWRQIQAASTTSTTTNPSSNTSCRTHAGGRDGARVSLCTATGGNHNLYPDVNGAGIPTIAWSFFEARAGGTPPDNPTPSPTVVLFESFDNGLGRLTGPAVRRRGRTACACAAAALRTRSAQV